MSEEGFFRRTGRRVKACATGLPVADKTVVALGAAVVLLFLAFCIAGVGTHAAKSSADAVASRHLPLLEAAHGFEEMVSEAVFHVSMFGYSGDIASYSGARIRFAAIREGSAALAARVASVPENQFILRSMEELQMLIDRLDLVIEKKRALDESLAMQKTKLRGVADAMEAVLLDLQARTASVAGARKSEESLDEKARLLKLSGFALNVEAAAGRALSAGDAVRVADMGEIEATFTEQWRDARDACVALPHDPAADPTVAAKMDTLVAEFRETLEVMRYAMEETARLSDTRTATAENLTALTRAFAAHIRSDMTLAASKADRALSGALATLAACAMLACALAGGSVIIFVRSRRES